MFKVITDPVLMDEMWDAGLLWCRDYIDAENGWGEWWPDKRQDWQSPDGNEPSKYVVSCATVSEFAILLEY